MKAMKSIGKVVFVDITKGVNEEMKLPSEVTAYFDKIKEDTIPSVVIVSPDLTQCFGFYSYSQLKPQNYSKIFKEAKKKIKEAKKAGGLSSVGKVEVAEAEAKDATDTDTVTINSPTLETWKSKQGSEIKAMLIRVEHDDLFIFKTSKGKTLKVKPSQLSSDSVERVEKLVAENLDKA